MGKHRNLLAFSTINFLVKMTHVQIDPDAFNWNAFIAAQEQYGMGVALPPSRFFAGTKYQRGNGILGSIARFITPIAKNILTSAGQEGLAAGARVLGDVQQGRSLKEAFKQHAMEGMQNVGAKLAQCGKGKDVKRRRKRKKLSHPITILDTKIQRRRPTRRIDQLSLV